MKKGFPSLVLGNNNPNGEKKAESKNTHKTPEKCAGDAINTMNPMVNTTLNSYFGKGTPHLFEYVVIVPRPQPCCYSHQNTRMRQSYDETSGLQNCV